MPLLSEIGFAGALRDQDPARPTASPTPPIETDEDVVRIKTNLVQMDVVAVDDKGRCRLDLSNVEARAREDGRQDFSLKLSIRVAGPDGRDFKQAERDISFNVTGAELETARRDGVLSTFSFEEKSRASIGSAWRYVITIPAKPETHVCFMR